MFTVKKENATKFGTKNEILQFFLSSSDFLWLYYSRFMRDFIWFELYHAIEAIL